MSGPVHCVLLSRDKCISCQTTIPGVGLTSTEHGMRTIRYAANIRRDDVFHRLNVLSPTEKFYYHTNDCYKSYTHKKTLQKILRDNSPEANNEEQIDNNDDDESVLMDQGEDEELDVDFNKCIFCGNDSYKKDNRLITLGNKRMKSFIDAVEFLKDTVFDRISTLKTPKEILDAELQYHASCFRTYERKYARLKNSKTEAEPNLSVSVNNALEQTIRSLESRLALGEIFSLNDVLLLLQKNFGSGLNVKNTKIKSYLINYYEDKICFVYRKQKNLSQLFYSSNLKPDAEKIYNKNLIIEEIADKLKEVANEVDFGLEDKLCNVVDLKSAWESMIIPEPFLTLLSRLFDLDKDEILPNEKENSTKISRSIKLLRVRSAFQFLYFLLNNGKKKTPLHMLIASTVYSTTKSKNLLTILNRFGISVSYDQMLRTRTRLALHALTRSEGNVPMPNHFNTHNYVTAAFDNFDHNECTISGLNSTHDTVIVIFQNEQEDNSIITSNTHAAVITDKRARCFTELLQCQQIKNYGKKITVEIPPDYTVNSDRRFLTVDKYFHSLRVEDYAWLLARMNLFTEDTSLDLSTENQSIPSWSSFNSVIATDFSQNLQKVGYLPIIPAPVTDPSTVYTCLCNFLDLLNQLEQEFLAVFCDEGVYRIAKPIIMENPKFKNIILCLGDFHITKVLHTCIGKYLQESGVRDIFIETDLFGLHVVDQILSGTHYARCTKAFTYLAEALRRLQFNDFFTEERKKIFENEIIYLHLLKESFETKDFEECRNLFEEFKKKCENLLKEFQEFVDKRNEESQLYKYYNTLLVLISLMHDLIRADRTGDWKLHLETVEKLLPIIHVMDRTNYARFLALYLEEMLMLEKIAPEVYRQFMNGRFTVKRSTVPFTSVAVDQGLEQTVNRTSKSSGGVIGSTRKKETVAIWDITFHDFLALVNYVKELILFSNEDDEVMNHHEFSRSATHHSEVAVQKILNYLQEKNVNPFMAGPQKLRNIITEELVHSETAKELLSIFEKGIELYDTFRRERLIEKSKLYSASISRNNLPNFKSVPKGAISKSDKTNKFTACDAQRIVALAKERNYPIKNLLQYELTNKNMLFDDDGLFKKYDDKSSLVRELEKALTMYGTEFPAEVETCLVIDVMLVMRSIQWRGLKTFNNLAQKFCEIVKYRASLQRTTRIDFVFDSYFDKSIKTSEHLRRTKNKSHCIVYNTISGEKKLPKQEETFWSSSENKILLQKFLQTFIETEADLFKDYHLVFSTINDQPSKFCNINTIDSFEMLQRTDIEEADLKIVLHIKNAATQGYKNVYVMSSDTDVIVLALYFFKSFMESGLETLWFRAGTGKSIRDIPLHTLVHHYGLEFCSILPALHHLTGADYTSKVGTKHSAISCEAQPVKYLSNFAKTYTPTDIERDIRQAEEYLVRIMKKTNCTTFDDLRYWSYHYSKCPIEKLPPTSNSMRLHIRRAFYVVFCQIHCLDLNVNVLKPEDFGWIEKDELLVPEKICVLIPPSDELIYNCNCTVCSTKACICSSSGIPCCTFCNCQKSNTCKNTIGK